MPGRKINPGSYRYGFNGKENDNETGTQDYGMRIYDGRIAKFLSVDPLTKDYAELTPYQFGSNSPIVNIDIDGLEGGSTTNPYASYGITEWSKPTRPKGGWGRVACDYCELDVLRNTKVGQMKLGTTGKIYWSPNVFATGSSYPGTLIYAKPIITFSSNTVVGNPTPIGPPQLGNAIGAQAALAVPVNFNAGTPVLTAAGPAQINAAVAALFAPAGVWGANASPPTNGIQQQSGIVQTANPDIGTSIQVATSTQGGNIVGQTTVFTLDFSTTDAPGAITAVINQRFNVIRAQMILQGVPASNINMGVINYNTPQAAMGGNPNVTTFRAQQFQSITPATQTTTTTTTTTYDYSQ